MMPQTPLLLPGPMPTADGYVLPGGCIGHGQRCRQIRKLRAK